MPTKASVETSIEEKMEEILVHLRKMDKRDKLRTWGSLFRSVLSIIPLIFFLWSVWYFINHGDEIMKQIANTAASSAAEYTKDQSQGMLDQFMNQYSLPGQK